MSRFSTIIFDLDGTLIHSVPDMHAAVNALLVEESAQPLDEATVQSFVGNGLPKLVERVIGAAGLDMARHQELSDRTLAFYNRENGARTHPYPGVSELLDGLSARGAALGICTNKPEAPAHHILEHLGLARRFPVIVGGDSLEKRKPDPEPLLHTMRALGSDAAQTLYVGDSEVDAETAERAGLPFALYTRGYRKSPSEDFETILAFDHFDELAQYLS